MASKEVKRQRRGSYEFEDLPSPPPSTSSNPTSPTSPPQRTRVISNPGPGANGPVSAGPYRSSFSIPHGHGRSGSTASVQNYGYNSPTSSVRGSISSLNGRPGGSSFSSTGSGFGPYGTPGGSANASSSTHAGHKHTGAHNRVPSVSNSDIAASPFRSSFSSLDSPTSSSFAPLPSSMANGTQTQTQAVGASSQAGGSGSRRHSRIHSRNLSIYFPRPGATTVHSIAEDGTQEIETPIPNGIPSAGSSASPKPPPSGRSQLGGNFKFGGRPPPPASSSGTSSPTIPVAQAGSSSSEGTSQDGISSVPMSKANTIVDNIASNGTAANISGNSTTKSRKGHHHRHSLSHSFFSFMEPGSSSGNFSSAGGHRRGPSGTITLNVTNASPTSPTANGGQLTASGNGWGPISPFPLTTTSQAFPPAQLLPPKRTTSYALAPTSLPQPSTQRSSTVFAKLLGLPAHMRYALAFGAAESLTGCLLWVMGQHLESLACTGLAYWVVFDSAGVLLNVWGRLIDAGGGRESLRLPFGAKRTEAVALFAQAIYLLFSAVYICKETLEHALLSSGGDSGHHHHQGESAASSGLRYPSTFLWLSFIALSLSSTLLKTNAKLLEFTGLYIPSLRHLSRSLSSSSSSIPSLTSPFRPSSSLLLSNPYSVFPLACTILLLSASTLPLDGESQRSADMLIAGIEAVGTAYLAWPACLVLGKVLLQTAPERSASLPASKATANSPSAGTMEALLRVMKEVERHPQVLHLPAPHVWQISPPSIVSGLGVRNPWTKQDASSNNGHGHANGTSTARRGEGQVVVTVELHVRKELEDVECLELTRWAWQRCVNALGQGEEGVTVGIVRG